MTPDKVGSLHTYHSLPKEVHSISVLFQDGSDPYAVSLNCSVTAVLLMWLYSNIVVTLMIPRCCYVELCIIVTSQTAGSQE